MRAAIETSCVSRAYKKIQTAQGTKGDRETAIRYYQRSLELDPDNGNAIQKIEQLLDELQVSRLSLE